MIANEWKFIGKNRLILISVLAIMIIPFLYSIFFLKSVWNPYGETQHLPVAVVNNDQAVSYQGKTLSVGDQAVKSLKKDHQLGWRFVSEDKAKQGLKDKKYYTVVTFPKDTSKNAASVLSKNPKKMDIQYETNGSLNYIGEVISQIGASGLNEKIRQTIIKAYADATFQQIHQVGKGMNTAAKGAKTLSNGQKTLGNGLDTYTAYVSQVNDGVQTMKMSVGPLASGVNQLADGGNALNTGLQQLNGSTGQLAGGVSQLAGGSGQLASGLGTYTNGVGTLNSGLQQLNGSTGQLASGVGQLNAGVNDKKNGLQSGINAYTSGVGQVKSGLDELTTHNSAILGQLNSLSNDPALAKVVKLEPQLPIVMGQINDAKTKMAAANDSIQTLQNLNLSSLNDPSLSNLKQLPAAMKGTSAAVSGTQAGLQQAMKAVQDAKNAGKSSDEQLAILEGAVNSVNGQLADPKVQAAVQGNNTGADLISSKLVPAIDGLQSQVNKVDMNKLNDALNSATTLMSTVNSLQGTAPSQAELDTLMAKTTKLQQQMPGIVAYVDNVGKAADGVSQIAANSGALNQGVAKLSGGIGELNNQVPNLVSGVSQLANGSQQLNANSGALVSGANQLNGGLGQLNAQVPQLVGGVSQLANGSYQLSGGLNQLNGQIPTLTNGVNQLADGTSQLNANSPALKDGSKQLVTGSVKLSGALGDGAKQVNSIPLSSKTSDMFSAPTKLTHKSYSKVANYGHALAPYVLSVALYVGAVVFNFAYPIRKVSMDGQSATAWFFSKATVGLVVAFVQAVAETGLMLLFGLQVDHLAQMFSVAIAFSVASMFLVMFLSMLLDNPGRFIAMVVLMLQLGGSGGTFPMQVTNGFYNAIHPFLPMTYSILGLRQGLTSGLGAATAWNSVGLLTMMAVIFAALLWVSMIFLQRIHLQGFSQLDDNQKLQEVEK